MGSLGQSYALSFVQRVLKKNSLPIKIISRTGEREEVVYVNNTAKNLSQLVVIYVNGPNFWRRVCSEFDLGFAEAYILQEIDCDDLSKVFDLYLQNPAISGSGSFFLRIIPRIAKSFRPKNSAANARINIASHYDTSNELFRNFLSSDMNYSCAHWSGSIRESLRREALQAAQRRKVHLIIKKARVKKDHHLLDIGCGWGDLVIEAVKTTGCRATGLTLSGEQKSLAEQRVKEAGLQDRIDILLCDYRKAPRPVDGYDQVVSVGMFEHVGAEFLDKYFETISGLLNKETGVMVVDGITKINPFHKASPKIGDYLHRYVFPGGYLPTIKILLDSLHKGSKGSLEVTSVMNTGPHYGKTLLAWRDNFLANWENIKSDFRAKHPGATDADVETYRRKWLYYFLYSEAGFRGRILGNYLVTAVRTPEARVSYDDISVSDL